MWGTTKRVHRDSERNRTDAGLESATPGDTAARRVPGDPLVYPLAGGIRVVRLPGEHGRGRKERQVLAAVQLPDPFRIADFAAAEIDPLRVALRPGEPGEGIDVGASVQDDSFWIAEESKSSCERGGCTLHQALRVVGQPLT